MSNIQNYIISQPDIIKKNLELTYNTFFTPLSVGLPSGSDPFTGKTFDGQSPLGGATKDSAIIAIDGSTSPDYFQLQSDSSATAVGFEVDFRRPVTSSITVTEDDISEYDPDATFVISNPDNLFDGDFGTNTNFGTAITGETIGFEIDLGDGEYIDNLEIALKNAGFGSIASETFTIAYSINGTDFIIDRSDIDGGDLDITGNVFNLFNIHYNAQFQRDYTATMDGGWTQKGKIPKIKKLRIYIDSCTAGLSFHITQLRVNKVEFEEPDGIYLDSINIKYTHAAGGSGNVSYQVAYEDEEAFTVLGTNNHSGYGVTTFNVNSLDRKVKKFRISYPSTGTSTQNLRIYDITGLAYYSEIPEMPNFEFNDSVLETKAWNSSRYDGKQLEGAVINEFRSGDTSYGKTPVLRRYTKNIYIGNNIIGLDSSSLASDNSDLTPFNERFSYVQCNTFITVNDDGTIEKFTLDDTKGNNLNKIGFYRAFNDDFDQGDKCNVLITDPVVENNLKSSHNIYFNEGQFKSLFNLTTRNDDGQYVSLIYTSGSFNTINIYAGAFDYNEGIINYGVDFRNIPLTQLFYTRSLYLTNSPSAATEVTDTRFHEIFEGFFNYKNNAEYKGDKRLFATFISGSGIGGNFKTLQPIILEEEENYGGIQNAIKQDLSFLSTCEITSVTDSVLANDNGGGTLQADTYKFHIDKKYNLSQDYQSRDDFGSPTLVVTQGQTNFGLGAIQPQAPSALRVGGYEKGSLLFSLCDDNIPSLLIDLNKALELPSGQGTKPFIIIPSNLHPYIKDNLFYFLTRAGIDIGGNTSAIIPLDQTNRYIDRIGWNPPKPAPTPELQAAQDAKTEITFEQRRRLARELAEQNRKRRLEKLREEEENSRRNKRRSRRKGRQEDREERRALREERKEKRRENRQENRNERRENRQNRRENRRNRRRNR
jgi:hypothetical protein